MNSGLILYVYIYITLYNSNNIPVAKVLSQHTPVANSINVSSVAEAGIIEGSTSFAINLIKKNVVQPNKIVDTNKNARRTT